MHETTAAATTLGLVCLIAPDAALGFDEFADAHAPRHLEVVTEHLSLVVKGELELELHDLEGRGGPGHDSVTDTRTLGTRSPFVEIDSFWIAARLGLGAGVQVNTIVELSQTDARVGAAWLDLTRAWLGIEHHLEAGYHTPFVKPDRRTERYPLIGTIYWREPEIHLSWEGRLALPGDTAVALGLSAAMIRPLAFAPVQEATSQPGTIQVLGYGRARPFSGNAGVYGAKLEVGSHGFFVTGFGFLGRLAAEAGTDELRNNFGGFRDLPGFNADETSRQDSRFYWYGGRAGFDRALRVWVEGIASRESLLRRYGGYAQASFEVELRPDDELFHTVEPLLRYELYRLRGTREVLTSGQALRSPAPSDAVTWDFTIVTAAIIAVLYRDMLRLRLEYYWIEEANGVPDLDIPSQSIRNDELLVQLELRF